MNTLDYQQIFHEIKNTVTLINSSAQLLNTKCPHLHTEPYWNNIWHEITYLKNIVLDLSHAGGTDQLQKEPVDLNPLLKDTCRFVKDAYPNLQWNLDLCNHLPVIQADSIKLRQAILNLLKNSAESGSAWITIRTRSSDSFVEIAVTDCGGGIPLKLEDKVFDLFTTSKENGTGLGLPITRQIVEAHGGTLRLDNRPGDGCSFTICLYTANAC